MNNKRGKIIKHGIITDDGIAMYWIFGHDEPGIFANDSKNNTVAGWTIDELKKELLKKNMEAS